MMRSLLPLALFAVLVAGCGDDQDRTAVPGAGSDLTEAPCEGQAPAVALGSFDVDGDGKPDRFSFRPAARTPGDDCFTVDTVTVTFTGGGEYESSDVPYEEGLPLRGGDVRGVRVPGHRGALVLVVQQHPRGGFSAHLSAFDGRQLSGVGSASGALAPFVATDAPTAYVSARCTSSGFKVTRAVAHQPVGVVPTWDVTRMSFRGDDLAAGGAAEVADNVREPALRSRFPGLVRNQLFENC